MTTTSTSHPSSSRTLADFDVGSARVHWTGREEGDLGSAGRGAAARRRAVEARPWAWLHQVHGAAVHVVTEHGGVQGEEGDALVTAEPGAVLAVFTADCAPVALASPEGVIGLAHAGWRGIEAGVVSAAVEAMRRLGATRVDAAVGPCIHACCYAFGERDLDRLEHGLGPSIRARTRAGEPALDLPAAVEAALAATGARLVFAHEGCTGCETRWFSHRARQEAERQATLLVRHG